MCSKETHLCRELINELFGDIVAQVAFHLCQSGWHSLRFITIDTKLKRDQVRKALCVLIQHKLVTFQLHKQNVQYKANVKSILSLIFYPRMIYTAKLLYGDVAELIIEEILQHGIASMRVVFRRVMDRLQNSEKDENIFEKVETAFKELVQTHFLQREPEVEVTEDGEAEILPSLAPPQGTYVIPSVSHSVLKRQQSHGSNEEPKPKRLKTSDGSEMKQDDVTEDDGIYWSVNISRFEQFFRDQSIVGAVTQKHGTACGEIVRAMLRISEVTTSADAVTTQVVSAAEVSRSLPNGYSIPMEHINQHLRLLMNDGDRIVELCDESGGGGSYVINLKNAAFALATASILSYVQERFGSKSCRIFRLLLMKKHLEQKQVEEFAMIPSKEAKEYLYNMLGENMLTMQEIPRTPDHAPSRTFYLFSVNMQCITRMLLVRAYNAISNMIVRQKHCIKTNKRLLDKQDRITAIKVAQSKLETQILSNFMRCLLLGVLQETLQDADQAQLEEIDEMMSSTERVELEKHKHSTDKLHNAQLQIAETVFILDSYLNHVLNVQR